MNIRTVGIIIRREYLNRVQKKSFLVTTFIVPVLMAALCVVPIVVMMNSKEETKKIAVVDRSGIVMKTLEDNEAVDYVDYGGFETDSVKAKMNEFGLDAVLSISPLTEDKSVQADISSFKPLGMDMLQNINDKIESAVEAYRIEAYAIPGLDRIMEEVKADIRLNTYTIDEDGGETISEAGVFAVLSMVLGLLLFLFITLFGGMVMSAVIEEKSSRVVEVLVSSVKATELMFGKILGIAFVALTQFLLWIVLTGVLVSAAGSAFGADLLSQVTSSDPAVSAVLGEQSLKDCPEGHFGEACTVCPEGQPSGDTDELSVVLTTLENLPVGKMLLVFLLFFFFGYTLYASMFAAVGSAVENEGDTQQLQMPLTIPLMIAYFIAIYSFNAPDSSVAFWGSMIPFTSPIVMLARLPFGVPDWEIAVSLLVLVATTALLAWVSAKIYKVGILVFGKKSTWKDLWKWFRQS